ARLTNGRSASEATISRHSFTPATAAATSSGSDNRFDSTDTGSVGCGPVSRTRPRLLGLARPRHMVKPCSGTSNLAATRSLGNAISMTQTWRSGVSAAGLLFQKTVDSEEQLRGGIGSEYSQIQGIRGWS